MALELIAGVVLGHLSAGAGKVAMAPAEAYAEHWKDKIKLRLDATRAAGEAKKKGEPFDVNDRVAFKTLSEAAFNDDELVADYLGGVLAASSGDDDAGVSVVALIGRLSAVQLRFHYVVYRELRRLWTGTRPNLYEETEAGRAGIRLPISDIAAAIGPQSIDLGSVVPVLITEGLLHKQFKYGPDKENQVWEAQVRPSSLGAQLFLWGHGVRPPQANRLFEPGLELTMLTDVNETPGAALLSPPKPETEEVNEGG